MADISVEGLTRDVVARAVSRGWKQIGSGDGEYQWRSADGETSPRWTKWEDATDWLVQRLNAEATK